MEAGRAYFPLTPLVAKAVSNDTAPDLGPHFSWITDSSIIRDFRQVSREADQRSIPVFKDSKQSYSTVYQTV